jgi:hypothetical protein
MVHENLNSEEEMTKDEITAVFQAGWEAACRLHLKDGGPESTYHQALSRFLKSEAVFLDKDDKALIPSQFNRKTTHVFIGDSPGTLAAQIKVSYWPEFIPAADVNSCLEVWSNDLAGTLALHMNNTKEC